ncbi:mannose-1-phosphate guanylyltransferase/mannose-6-phosphate isomerase [Thiomicrorhabdus sp. ZW0627]|uniref:mannose-1-phosphate guanylyltransferase/mannose-6-phosphate isomerase n=1 Tax=Thiomicrorhabdus sp. ZW0627 TaxID=3039774 RepID=UPI0024366B8B|nr:mannose-1-phosphate guanylyltransferase/mannose-6-phosphate isomerase [Thiomicrorhabdus sp. ZW0627]MDG6773614.1 mannose-1-phosphate guanylyltransferase/mannose-6-phosphate isomerase [Thiomicrorhabdus sp. ZW0627]
MINIILCGGSGTRLWPLSRTMLPKQFVRLFDGESLFQQTVKRNEPICSRFLIVSNTDQYFLAVDQLNQMIKESPAHFLLEPVGRNTAPAIALACLSLDEDDLVLVTTSDHLVKNREAYEAAVRQARSLAEEGNLVTFGIHPTYPETGFGYIEASGNDVLSFKEKPSEEVAQTYINQGNYYWNSGMFCFKAGVFLNELKKHSPEIYQACLSALPDTDCDSEMKIDLDLMRMIPEDSIDYAVMEKSDKVKVVACDMGWSDLGSFDSLYDELKSESAQNAVLARVENSPEPICVDSTNNLLVTRDRQIALVDVEDLLVVDTTDAILVSKKGSSQKVKQVVAQIKKQAPELAEIHRLAYRPWGTYEVLIDSEQYKVKRIVVKPGSKLSLQKHFHRNEHWIVVSGTATVTVDSDVFLVRANESTYIQMGQVHRLENQGKIDLVMIEVQVGEYTGEDDIVRIEDIYGR